MQSLSARANIQHLLRYRDIYSQFPIIQQIVEFYGKSTPVLQPVAGPGAWSEKYYSRCCC